jgi:hypothetical protein
MLKPKLDDLKEQMQEEEKNMESSFIHHNENEEDVDDCLDNELNLKISII